MLTPTYQIPALPPPGIDLDSTEILRALAPAHRYLAELKGSAKSIPNQAILVNTLALQEAKASSEIESYVTTQDELFQADLHLAEAISPAAKEVARYREALTWGFERMRRQQGLLTNSMLTELFQMLKNSAEGFRIQGGTVLKNERTGATVFVPPQEPAEIERHMRALEQFTNDETLGVGLDPLVRMALIHHQFESIHPFSDGNGRIGRILCVLYLTKMGLLDTPVLYLSRYINQHKADYYRLLQAVRDQGQWEAWLVFMLNAVAHTAKSTIALVEGMRQQMIETKQRLRQELPKLYSQDLLNNLFRHPYTRIEFVQKDLGVTRQTAAKYLRQLAQVGLVQEHSVGKAVYFINEPLVRLLMQAERGET
jgi:Fic family protein